MRCFPFDLETVVDDAAIALMPPRKAPKNWKDPEKIAAFEAQSDPSKLACDPACARIVAIGYGPSVTVCPDVDVERAALIAFWEAWVECPLPKAGYNVLSFDLPMLVTRSRILRVPFPTLVLSKYKVQGVVDLMVDLHPVADRNDIKSLNFWCKRLNLDVPVDTTSGADVAAMVASGNWEGVVNHCQIDLLKTAALYDYLYPAPSDDDIF